MRVWWLVMVVVLGAQESLGSRILMLTPIVFKSHTIFYRGVAKALVEHGHEVTQVLPFNNSAARGVREVVLPVPNIIDVMNSAFNDGTLGFMKFSSKLQSELCIQALTSEEFLEIRKQHFDVVIFSEWMCYGVYEYISTLKVPFILIQGMGMEFSFNALNIGNPFFTSFVPNVFLDYSPRPDGLTYWERMVMTPLDMLMFLGDYANMNFVTPKYLKYKGICSDDCPDLYTTRTNTSLLIINSFKTMERVVQPHVPAIIRAGGIHINHPKPLSPVLEEWVAGAGQEGFIFFSLGSVVKPSDMPENTRLILVKVLGSLKQRVLWKWDKDNMEDLPSNVKISKWLPQQDILSHPKLELFMTHGGLHSSQEAFYNGVPVLGKGLL
ncbi:unnamed protein product, partial [Meganyctiphanes norvegica]